MFEHNIITPLVSGMVSAILLACVAFILAVGYSIISKVVKESREYHREEVLANYLRAEAHAEWKLARSEVTGILYSKGG